MCSVNKRLQRSRHRFLGPFRSFQRHLFWKLFLYNSSVYFFLCLSYLAGQSEKPQKGDKNKEKKVTSREGGYYFRACTRIQAERPVHCFFCNLLWSPFDCSLFPCRCPTSPHIHTYDHYLFWLATLANTTLPAWHNLDLIHILLQLLYYNRK